MSSWTLFFINPRNYIAGKIGLHWLGHIKHKEWIQYIFLQKPKTWNQTNAKINYINAIRYIVLMLFVFDFNVKSITEIMTIIL